MSNPSVPNFVVIDSIYGKFIINRHCSFQAEHLIKTGLPHIQPELGNLLTIAQMLPQGCVIVDAGANAGLVTVPCARAVRERGGKVYSFEVQRMMYNALCGTIALNDLDNVVVINKGLGAGPATVQVTPPNYSVPQDFGMFSLVSPGQTGAPVSTAAPEIVEIMALDDLNLPRLDFLKIDVEGMEIDVLKGAQTLLHKHQPWCWIEYWKVDIADIKAQFTGLAYKFYKMDELNLMCVPEERVKENRPTIPAPEV